MSPGGVPVHRVRGRLRGDGHPVTGRLELAICRPGEDPVHLPAMELHPAAPLVACGRGTTFEAAFLVPRSWVSSRFRYEVVACAAAVAAARPPVERPAPPTFVAEEPIAWAPRRPPRRPRRARSLALALLACGVVLSADAVVTMVWQDPVTSLYTAQAQAGLRDRLASATRTFTATRVAERPAAPAAAPVATRTVGVYPAPRHAASTAGDVARRAARFASLYDRGTSRGEPLGTIRIPRIGLKMVFVQGTGAAQLRQGPAHYVNTSMPGQPGTVGIAGHRTTYLAPFHDLDQLRRGDPIELDTPYGTFTYAVEGQAVVAPTYVNILDPSWTTQRLVLTSCHPLRSAAERIVVVARLRNMKVI